LVEAGNYQEFADYTQKLLSAPELRIKMGEEGRRRIETSFSNSALWQNTKAVYQGLLKKKSHE